MTTQPYTIKSFEVGLEKDKEPWLIPETAFPEIIDMYVWRKRVLRRIGNQFLGRLSYETSRTYTAAVSGVATSFNTTPDNLSLNFITNVQADTPVVGQTRITTNTNHLTLGQTFTVNSIVGSIGTVLNNVLLTALNPTGTTVDVTATSTGLTYTSGGLIIFPAVVPSSVTLTINTLVFTDDGLGNMLLLGVNAGTINYITGQIIVNFSAIGGGPYDAVVVYSTYSGLPVMGLDIWEQPAINDEDLIAFDTRKANVFNSGTNQFEDITFYDTTGSPFSWTGNNSNFFWSDNYQGAFFTTNNVPGYHSQVITMITAGNPTVIDFASNVAQIGDSVFIQNTTGAAADALNNLSFIVTGSTATSITIAADTTAGIGNVGQVLLSQYAVNGDGIRYYANDSTMDGWANFNPLLNPTNALKGGRLIVPYRNRLVILSPIEGDPANAGNFIARRNRARWSQNGTVFYSTPIPENQTSQGLAWRDDIPGRGGYEDAPTSEAIVSAQFIRDILIVFFERSTWALRYTGNSGQPFVWSRVNVELGSGSQFSIVPFDRGVLAVGNRGIITSDGNNVNRIDLIIPDTVFGFQDTPGSPPRVHGIRDFFRELVYWCYPDETTTNVYPNRMLVYNYRENSYSIFKDIYTCFGEYSPAQGLTWDSADIFWDQADFNWNASDESSIFPKTVAGTPTGFVMVMNQMSGNSQIISIIGITNAVQALVTTFGEHNLETDAYVQINSVPGGSMTEINGLNSQIEVITSTSFLLLNIDSTAFTPYTIGGFVTILNQFSLRTKQINPFVEEGRSTFMTKMDVYSDYISSGQVAVQVYTDDDTENPVNVPLPNGARLWQNIIPLDLRVNGLPATKTWTRFFCHTRGQFLQIQFTLNHDQMLDNDLNTVSFTLHAVTLHLGKSGRLISR